jgi:hypothetical protein
MKRQRSTSKGVAAADPELWKEGSVGNSSVN